MTVDQENIQKRARSFNPCFGGSYIMTSQQINSRFSEISFNPCFGGSYIMTMNLPSHSSRPWWFQSLFWWILYYDPRHYILIPVPIGRFNPCFGGSYIMTSLLPV